MGDLQLVDKILAGEVEQLNEQDRFQLFENRKEIIPRLLRLFSEKIPCLQQKGKCQDYTSIFWGLKLAAFLKTSEAFEWIQRLCHVSTEHLDQYLGFEFITDELAYLLASTVQERWTTLQLEIEDLSLDKFIRHACLDALVFSVAMGWAKRADIVNYFKSLFQRILNGEFDEKDFPTDLICSCTDLWPGECLEEIRELFGLDLISESLIDLTSVLDNFAKGEEACVEQIKRQIQKHSFLEEFKEEPRSLEKVPSQKWDQFFHFIETRMEEVQATNDPQRNDPCSCGSGKKYKKCCLNRLYINPSPGIRTEESAITYDASDMMKAFTETEKELILDLYDLLQEDPAQVVEQAPSHLSQYPNIPTLYNYLYSAYRRLHQPQAAMKILQETLRLFPDYLFSRVEYALYFLRRGEPEKAYAALGNANTLSQLYPDRTVFHVSEWKAFSFAMSLYYVQKDDIQQAKVYRQILQKIDPDCDKIEVLDRKIKNRLFHQALHQHLPKLSELPT